MFYGDKSTLFEQHKQKQQRPDQPIIAVIGGNTGLTIANRLAEMTIAKVEHYHDHTELNSTAYESVQIYADRTIALMDRDGGWRLACQSGRTTLVSIVILAFPLPKHPRQSEDLLIQNLLVQGWIQPAKATGIALADYPFIASQRHVASKKLYCAYTSNGLSKPSDQDINQLCLTIQATF